MGRDQIPATAVSRPGGASCLRVESCALFPKLASSVVLHLWQTHYCHARFETCTLFKLAIQGRPVPGALLPNGQEMSADLRLLVGR